MISVSVETNCREGPSQDYSRVGYLLPGQTSTVHGRNDANTWWYIENPKKPGQYCWLWGEYATVEGDLAGLVVVTPPPPPAPVAGYVNEEYGFYLEPVAWIERCVREGVAALPAGTPLYAGLYLPDIADRAGFEAAVAAARAGGARGVSLFGGVRAIPAG